ncbi:hypothetical protein D9611_002200 [Ephemerocybe angulata]|uniref:NAD-dependent protein deacylase n=1 Tax=Ephemerocybe angulata TaxID=980116 RepID=A0A8H5FDZ7_9AGAR|nr:hypothetical protein D9611_002200 [Tulosesus angulatus]
MPSTDIDAFKHLLGTSKHIIAVAGAGLSAASGIPTFRGAGGMWRKYDAMSLATPEAFEQNPSLVWQFYHYRREAALKAEPNAAHLVLSKFSIPDIRHAVAPSSSFTLITQNVDNLSPRANERVFAKHGAPPASEPPHIFEMHGRLFDVNCTNPNCEHTEFNTASPICEALKGTEKLVEEQHLDSDLPVDQLPHCSKCGALTRPGVVWFGEIPHDLHRIDKLVQQADLCLVVGTSSTVYPAAGYAVEVAENGGKVAVFNAEDTGATEGADFVFVGPCETTLPKALGI